MLHQLYLMQARAMAQHRTRAAHRIARAIDRRIARIGGWA